MSDKKPDWYGKPYYSLDAYCKNTFHHKCYKIALNAHMSCPNRDGTLDTRGCIFCSEGGSGDFAVSTLQKSMAEQIEEGIRLFKDKKVGNHFIAYFQAYTNTYAPLEYLEKVYRQALEHPSVCGISIATRPDCMPDEVLDLLIRLQEEYAPKFIWVELGLQTIHEKTACFIRRGYPLSRFEECFERLQEARIPVIVHVILGLPGENHTKMLETVTYLNKIAPFGIKLQLLHVLKNTDLEWYYQKKDFEILSKEDYLNILTDCLAHLSPDIVIHRVTGDGPKELLIAPTWSLNKRDVLNSLHQKLKEENIYQGCLFR
ncbi:MAG: TIGR01212 family radical SAM protein [Lachnospiraceae bacterium]|nr:TIGR01212 family radical SAM protein [Lachnospiraceae bacterium]